VDGGLGGLVAGGGIAGAVKESGKINYAHRGRLASSVGVTLLVACDYYALPIRNTFVPQVGHTPWVAGLPFFIVMAFGFLISLLVRHFIQ
jgi:hypothetical protein